MPTKWVVTTPVDRIELDETQQGQTTFTVTNPTNRVDRVYFDVVVGDGADEAWFTIDEPQRRVPANGSVSYLIKTNIPATAKPGNYSVQGRAYSADSAPEEDSVLSSRLAVEVKAKAAPVVKKKFPWWIVVVAGLVVIVLVVVGILVFGGGGGTTATPPAEQVTVPDLAKQSEGQARTNLSAFGLSVGTIRHKFDDKSPDQVIYQSVAGGGKADKGSPVDLVITSALAQPTITAPANNATVPLSAVSAHVQPVPANPAPTPTGSAAPTTKPTATASASTPPATPDLVTWTDSDAFVTHWQVTLTQQLCVTNLVITRTPSCFAVELSATTVDKPSFSPILPGPANFANPYAIAAGTTATYGVVVAAVDDFGTAGQNSPVITFQVH